MAEEQKARRARTSIDTEFQAGALVARGKIQNVGEGGLFVKTGQLPTQGESVQVRFRNPDGSPMAVSGLVWWTTTRRHRTPGFGVRLIEDNARYDTFVRRLMGRR